MLFSLTVSVRPCLAALFSALVSSLYMKCSRQMCACGAMAGGMPAAETPSALVTVETNTALATQVVDAPVGQYWEHWLYLVFGCYVTYNQNRVPESFHICCHSTLLCYVYT